MFSFLRKPLPEIDYTNLISKLEKNNDFSTLLLKSERIDYLPATYSMLQKMSKPLNSTQELSLYIKHTNGKYELAVFEVPWNNSDIKFLPLILDKKEGKIVGVMLPFNELLQTLTKNEQRQIHQLGVIWTAFIMEARFGIKLNKS